ncbi:hypothetical protein AGMMS49982_14780 [Bacteroidia bacterium]|nr:hypothetical protein AGMMS49982_14780 [Bacteroidia bacterium]
MDELERIRRRRADEHRQGDVRRSCERAGVSTTVFQSALRKKKIDDLTDKEMKVIIQFKEVLDERIIKHEELRQML